MFKKKRYAEKAAPLSFNTNNKYPTLIPTDSLYKNQLNNLKQPQFQAVLTKITKDLNLLLYMNDNEFWRELDRNDSVGLCLQSCLEVFGRRGYDRFQNGGREKMETIGDEDRFFRMYGILEQTVLYVYYRISMAPSEKQRIIVYDLWLLDIPKLLDIASIYGESNPKITKKLIQNIYQRIKDYDGDTLDFFKMIQENPVLSGEERYVEIDFSTKSLNRKNYGNRQKYMFSQTGKEFYRVKDLLSNLCCFIRYFPEKYVRQFVSDYKIQERLLRGLALFLKEGSQDWKLEGYAKYFQMHFQDIRQRIAEYFVMVFKVLRQILEGRVEKEYEQFGELAQDTYETLCLCLTEKTNQPENPYYRRMVNHLLEETEEVVFFIPARKLEKANERTFKSIEQCVDYENYYRKEKRIAGASLEFDENYEKVRESYGKYRQMCAKGDGVGVKRNEEKLEILRLERQLSGTPYLNIFKMKYGQMSDEYYDEPEEQDDYMAKQSSKPIHVKKKYKQKNVDLSFTSSQKQMRYRQKTDLIHDSKLSIFQTSQMTESQNSQIFRLKGSQINSDFEESAIMGAKGQKIAQYRGDLSFGSEGSKDKSVDLSVFSIEGQREIQKNLSFSMMSEVRQSEGSYSFVHEESSSEQEDKNQLESIIADMESIVSSKTGAQTIKLEEVAKEEKDAEGADFERFCWDEEDLNLSIDFQIWNG